MSHGAQPRRVYFIDYKLCLSKVDLKTDIIVSYQTESHGIKINSCFGGVWCLMAVIPVRSEAEAGRSPWVESSRSAWLTW